MKNPLIKYTPSSIFAAEPVLIAPETIAVAKEESSLIIERP